MEGSTAMRARKKLAVLCADGPHHKYLVAQLQDLFDLAAVIVEPEAEKMKRLRRARRARDYLFAVYHGWRRKLLGLDAYRADYFSLPGEKPTPPARRTLITESINSDAAADLLAETAPDLTVVMGTSILRAKTLAAAGVAVNIHGGFLPDYKGNHCFFFALYEGRFDRVGSTIHFLDAGIDSGDIIEHIIPPLYPDDNAERLYCRAEKMAIHRLIQLIAQFEHGEAWPRHAQSEKGRTIRTRDRNPYHDLALWFRRRTGRFVMPKCQGHGSTSTATVATQVWIEECGSKEVIDDRRIQ
jgi:folate-dependent phosphoribosylglycinamide formyltransferase PurN